jgi:hypothetical protein
VNGSPRTLPIRIAPLPGEALDSWLEALAHRLHVSLSDLLPEIGLARRLARGSHLADIPTHWITMLRDEEATAVADATDLPPERVHRMTLAHYDGRAIRIDRNKRQVHRFQLWGRGRGSRFCPACLARDSGRWQLHWRLGWTFACLEHRRLLADVCPRCGRLQRQRPRSTRDIPHPGQCASPGEQGTARSRCGYPLHDVPSLELPPDSLLLRVQQTLTDTIETDKAAWHPIPGTDKPAPSLTVLTDIRALAGQLLADASTEQLAALVPDDVMALHLAPTEPASGTAPGVVSARPGFAAPARAASTAVALTVALHVLEQPDIAHAGTALRDLAPTIRGSDTGMVPSHLDHWHGISPRLEAIQISAIAPALRPSDQLRYRTAAPVPCRPHPVSASTVRRRARKIPGNLWPMWSAMLCPPLGAYSRTLRPVLACSVLMTGSREGAAEAAARLGSATDARNVSRMHQRLQKHGHWPTVSSALTRLTDFLDEADAPIDYARRRKLDYTGLLPQTEWKHLCDLTGVDPGQERRLMLARCLLFEHISGMPPELAPALFAIPDAFHRQLLTGFATVLTPELVSGLDDIAHAFLARHRIHDEPVTWQPPWDIIHGGTVPGCDPRQVDIPALHRLIRSGGLTSAQAAEHLGVTHDTIRFILHNHPAPAPPTAPDKNLRNGEKFRAARAALPKEEFARLYLDERRSLPWIAASIGTSTRVTGDLARYYGIPRRRPQEFRHLVAVDRDWLHHEYVICGRTLADLAKEKGMSTANMNRWAIAHGIPRRPRGGRPRKPAAPSLLHRNRESEHARGDASPRQHA